MPAKETPRKTQPRKQTARADRTKREATSSRTEAEGKYTPTSWGSSGIGMIEDLTVPSGQLCAVRRPGIEGLMKAGVLNNVDALTSLVEKEHVARHEGKPPMDDTVAAVNQLMNDPAKFAEMTHLVDRVVCHVVVNPPLHMTPNDITTRDPNKIYCDQVELEDKMFIFNFAVGGTRDLEQFRSERDGALERLDVQPDVGDSPE
jgi:hypothetical protein